MGKKSKYFWLTGILTVIVILVIGWKGTSRNQSSDISAKLIAPTAQVLIEGYDRAEGPKPILFPDDQGPHPDYQTEWWYYTGNLDTPDGHHFGYQLTFFRRALLPPDQITPRSSDWGTTQVYLAHFALTNVADQSHTVFERLERGAAGLAGAQVNPFQVWLDDWNVQQIDPGVYKLSATAGDIQLKLKLVDEKGPVLHGDQGYSQKGPDPGNASYYVSLTRLATDGSIMIGERTFPVSGYGWMDHEWSTSALTSNQVGWDWFSIQLDNDSELMVFQIRQADGSIDPYSSGTWIAPDGSTKHLNKDDFSIEVGNTWTSPHTRAKYPSSWKIAVPSEDLNLEILPYVADQELNVTYNYWEGAVKITGTQAGRSVKGNGYVELTGYAGSMGGEF